MSMPLAPILPDIDLQRAVNDYAARMRPAMGVRGARTRMLLVPFGDGTNPITATDEPARVPVPWDLEIIQWYLVANAAGALSLDVRRGSWSSYPTVTSITGGNYPAISGRASNKGPTTGWTTRLYEGDVLVVLPVGSGSVTYAMLGLKHMEVNP